MVIVTPRRKGSVLEAGKKSNIKRPLGSNWILTLVMC